MDAIGHFDWSKTKEFRTKVSSEALRGYWNISMSIYYNVHSAFFEDLCNSLDSRQQEVLLFCLRVSLRLLKYISVLVCRQHASLFSLITKREFPLLQTNTLRLLLGWNYMESAKWVYETLNFTGEFVLWAEYHMDKILIIVPLPAKKNNVYKVTMELPGVMSCLFCSGCWSCMKRHIECLRPR